MFMVITVFAVLLAGHRLGVEGNPVRYKELIAELYPPRDPKILEKQLGLFPEFPFAWGFKSLPALSYHKHFVATEEMRRRIENLERMQDDILSHITNMYGVLPTFEDDDDVLEIPKFTKNQEGVKKEEQDEVKELQPEKLEKEKEEETRKEEKIVTEVDNNEGKRIVTELKEDSKNSTNAAPQKTKAHLVVKIDISEEGLALEENSKKENEKAVSQDSREGKVRFPES